MQKKITIFKYQKCINITIIRSPDQGMGAIFSHDICHKVEWRILLNRGVVIKGMVSAMLEITGFFLTHFVYM